MLKRIVLVELGEGIPMALDYVAGEKKMKRNLVVAMLIIMVLAIPVSADETVVTDVNLTVYRGTYEDMIFEVAEPSVRFYGDLQVGGGIERVSVLVLNDDNFGKWVRDESFKFMFVWLLYEGCASCAFDFSPRYSGNLHFVFSCDTSSETAHVTGHIYQTVYDDEYYGLNLDVLANSWWHFGYSDEVVQRFYGEFTVIQRPLPAPPRGADITFFIVDDENWDKYVAGQPFSHYGEMLSDVAEGEFDFTMPYLGGWHFVFDNTDNNEYTRLHINIWREITPDVTTTETSTTQTTTTSETTSSVWSEEEGLTPLSVVLGIVGIIGIVVIGAVISKRGKKIEVVGRTDAKVLIVCPFCGAKTEQGLLKCQNCGADL